MPMRERRFLTYGALGAIFGLNLVSVYLIFLVAPPEATLGDAYRVFYLHVPAAWVSYLAFGVTLIGSIRYLLNKDPKWDSIAEASAKLGITFNLVALLSGSIWANLAWGSYWNWDPRETTTLILLIVYIAYLTFRTAVEDRERRARLSSVLGVLGFLSVPLSYASVELMTLHPGGGAPLSRLNLNLTMMGTLFVALIGLTIIYIYLLRMTYTVMKLEENVNILRYRSE
jgi:heme exporter protein C